MKTKFVAAFLFALPLLSAASTPAQSLPYLNELLARNAEFYRLYNEKRRGGKSVPQVEPLRLRGEQAFRAGKVDELLAILSEGTAILKGSAWDERQKFFASLTIEINRLVIEPNTELEVSLARMFPANLDKAIPGTPTVTFEVRAADAKSTLKPLLMGSRRAIAEATTMANRRLMLADGAYLVVASIESDGKKLGEVAQRIFAIAEYSDRLKAAQAQIAGLAASPTSGGKALADLAATPAFWIQRLLPLTQSAGEEPPNPVEELRRIEAAVAALVKGENPFASERGEVERAYRASDGQLVPYRIYVPRSYDAQTPRPLVVLLHGALGDEKTYFSNFYDEAVIKGEAEKRGWLFVAPNGRGRFGGYGRDQAIEDVTQVVGLVKREYKIDEAKVYLSGHSLGGGGTWIVAANRPDLFAALAPVSGGGAKEGEEVRRILEAVKNLPVLIVHGAKDGIVPPQGSREMYEAARKAGLQATYLELPNDDHVTIVGATFAEVLNFFDKHGKPGARQ